MADSPKGANAAPVSVSPGMCIARQTADAVADAGQGMARTVNRLFNGSGIPNPDPFHLAPAMLELGLAAARNPIGTAGRVASLWAAQADLLGRSMRYAATGAPTGLPDVTEPRLRGSDWNANAFFDWIRRAHIEYSAWLHDYVESADLPDTRARRKLRFAARILTEAASPANHPVTNPKVLRTTREEFGQNLVRGLRNKLADLAAQGWPPMPAKVDQSAFEFGVDVASTPGKVIWRNHLVELLQFTPTTRKVHAVPFLFVPPWINKYYILDLGEQKSMIRWLVAKGHTVFLISWVNPDESHADTGFEDYLTDGALAALDQVRAETRQETVNVAGYCLGGTLMGTALAWLAAQGDRRVSSCTFFASQFDFSDAGDLMAVTDPATVEALGREIRQTGYLPGSKMAGSFDLLRPGDLYWEFAVRSYLLGLDPPAFDLLYWNADSTRMPARMQDEYLRAFYIGNRLASGTMRLAGVRLNLGDVAIPTCHIATAEDHIAPPESVYRGMQLMGGPREFILADSGHIAGIINPPGDRKYGYRATAANGAAELAGWLETAPARRKGSWWNAWVRWLKPLSGTMVPARAPGATLGVIGDAPGRYVRDREAD